MWIEIEWWTTTNWKYFVAKYVLIAESAENKIEEKNCAGSWRFEYFVERRDNFTHANVFCHMENYDILYLTWRNNWNQFRKYQKKY